MPASTYRNRRAWIQENSQLRLTVLAEGGHIAELFHKSTKINPLWTPPWPTIEPSTYSPSKHPEYGADHESKLLSGIAGHNLCLDFFGVPSREEHAAGLTVHGEGSVLPYESPADGVYTCHLKHSHLRFRREIQLDGAKVHFTEEVENLLAIDRDVPWQEHVTLGPPFVERGITRIEAPVLRSARLDGSEMQWTERTYPKLEKSSNFHTNLLSAGEIEIRNEHLKLALRYTFDVKAFPWLGVWEENCGRATPPWNNRTITWGIEFGSSPYPESRAKRAARGHLWNTPTATWLPALSKRRIQYTAELRQI
jgi:hypothetical protein